MDFYSPCVFANVLHLNVQNARIYPFPFLITFRQFFLIPFHPLYNIPAYSLIKYLFLQNPQ